MSVCKSCGAEMSDDAKVCEACGAAVEASDAVKEENAAPAADSAAPAADSAAPNSNSQSTSGQSATDAIRNLNNTADTTNEFDPADIEKNKILAVLAYFGILFLVPLLAGKDSKFAQYHANQGIILFITWLIAMVARIMVAQIPLIGGITSKAIYVLMIILCIIGIVNAAQGKAKELPVIGKFKILK